MEVTPEDLRRVQALAVELRAEVDRRDDVSAWDWARRDLDAAVAHAERGHREPGHLVGGDVRAWGLARYEEQRARTDAELARPVDVSLPHLLALGLEALVDGLVDAVAALPMLAGETLPGWVRSEVRPVPEQLDELEAQLAVWRGIAAEEPTV